MTAPCNIAASLPQLARERPGQVAMRCPGRNGRYDIALTYADLDARSDAIAAGLALHDVTRGARVVVMLRPTPDFFLVMFALFKAGVVPVLVDPGIDKRALRQCLDEVQPSLYAVGFCGRLTHSFAHPPNPGSGSPAVEATPMPALCTGVED